MILWISLYLNRRDFLWIDTFRANIIIIILNIIIIMRALYFLFCFYSLKNYRKLMLHLKCVY